MLKTLSALCALAAACALFATTEAQATPASENFIQQNFDKGYVILNNNSLSEADRRDQFRALLMGLAGSRRIALFTLGSYAAGAAPAEIDAFVEAFTHYSVTVYEKGLNQYAGQTLKVTGSSERASDDSVVQAELSKTTTSNGRPMKLAFRVRGGENGAPSITDIQIEGISLAMTERAEFTAYLQQHNGSIPALSKSLGALSDRLAMKASSAPAIY